MRTLKAEEGGPKVLKTQEQATILPGPPLIFSSFHSSLPFRMKVAPKIIFLFKDPDSFGPAIFDALQLNPNFHVKIEEVHFELSLEKYGIRDCKGCGDVVHFVDREGSYQVSVLLLQNYEPPIVACVTNEVLRSITENTSTTPTFILPYFIQTSKLNSELINPILGNRKVSLYSTHIGPATDFTLAMVEETQKLAPSLQIHYEPLACMLQLIRVLNLPTTLVIGPRGRYQSKGSKEEVLEALYEMGEFLARNVGLCFMRERIYLNLTEKSKVSQEPWRALYG